MDNSTRNITNNQYVVASKLLDDFSESLQQLSSLHQLGSEKQNEMVGEKILELQKSFEERNIKLNRSQQDRLQSIIKNTTKHGISLDKNTRDIIKSMINITGNVHVYHHINRRGGNRQTSSMKIYGGKGGEEPFWFWETACTLM